MLSATEAKAKTERELDSKKIAILDDITKAIETSIAKYSYTTVTKAYELTEDVASLVEEKLVDLGYTVQAVEVPLPAATDVDKKGYKFTIDWANPDGKRKSAIVTTGHK